MGNDDYAKRMRERAEKDRMRTDYMVDADVPTGTCAVCISGVHRSLVANLAAANNYKVCVCLCLCASTVSEVHRMLRRSASFIHALAPTEWALDRVFVNQCVAQIGIFVTGDLGQCFTIRPAHCLYRPHQYEACLLLYTYISCRAHPPTLPG